MQRNCQFVVHYHGGHTQNWLFVNLLLHPMLTFCITVQLLWCPCLWHLILLLSWYILIPWLRLRNLKNLIWTRKNLLILVDVSFFAQCSYNRSAVWQCLQLKKKKRQKKSNVCSSRQLCPLMLCQNFWRTCLGRYHCYKV